MFGLSGKIRDGGSDNRPGRAGISGISQVLSEGFSFDNCRAIPTLSQPLWRLSRLCRTR